MKELEIEIRVAMAHPNTKEKKNVFEYFLISSHLDAIIMGKKNNGSFISKSVNANLKFDV